MNVYEAGWKFGLGFGVGLLTAIFAAIGLVGILRGVFAWLGI